MIVAFFFFFQLGIYQLTCYSMASYHERNDGDGDVNWTNISSWAAAGFVYSNQNTIRDLTLTINILLFYAKWDFKNHLDMGFSKFVWCYVYLYIYI